MGLQGSCIACPANSNSNADRTKCVCTGNRYLDSADNTCKACTISGQAPNAERTACETCADGRFPNPVTGNCDLCGPTQTGANGSCTNCAFGATSNAERTECRCLLANAYVLGVTNTCTPCRVGSVPNEDDTDCDVCPPGTMATEATGMCDRCPNNNQIGIDGQCEFCPLGAISNSARTQCNCPSNRYLDADAGANGECKSCPEGQRPNSAKDACEFICTGAPNTYFDSTSSTTGSRCRTCDFGKFADSSRTGCEATIDSCATIFGPPLNNNECTTCRGDQRFDEGSKRCVQCPVGQGLHPTNHKECRNCPSGQERTSSQTECTACTTGFSNGNGECRKCTGDTRPNNGRTGCSNCSGGRVQSTDGEDCICAAGKFGPINVSASCGTCPPGEIPNENDNRTSCRPGTPSTEVCATLSEEFKNNDCVACGGHQYFNTGNNRCTDCPVGHVQKTGDKNNSSCMVCPDGDGRTSSQTECTDCPNTHVSDGTGICVACTGNNIPNNQQTGCESCSTDRETADNAQCLCIGGKQGPTVNGSSCQDCAPGEISNPGRTGCMNTPCNPEQEYNYSSGSCVTTADSCAAVSRAFSNGSCVVCLDHQYFNTGTRQCVECPAGHVQDQNDPTSSACEVCPDGDGRITGQRDCTDCPAGQVSEGTGVCEACTGNNIPNSGQSSCTPCDSNREANTGKTQCVCPENHQGAVGISGACTACTGILISNADRTQCVNPVPSVEVCALSSEEFDNGACVPCANNEYFNASTNSCSICVNGHVQNPSDKSSSACMVCVNGEGRAFGELSCTICPAGQFSFEDGICRACSGNSISTSPGSSGCTGCQHPRVGANAEGNTGTTTGNTMCLCPENHEGAVAVIGACTPCAGNEVSNSDRTACIPAPPSVDVCKFTSQEFRNGRCVTCAGHEYFNTGNNRCTSCPVGHVQNPNDNTDANCTVCPDGQGRTSSQTSCTGCPDGLFNKDTGVCRQCAGNTIPNNPQTDCTPCSGDREAFNNNTQCRCPSGEQGAIGITGACSPCPGIQISNENRTQCVDPVPSVEVCALSSEVFRNNDCVPCLGNQYFNATSNQCASCPVGHVQNPNDKNNANCMVCPDGQGRTSSQAECTACPAGQFSSGTGVCAPCSGNSISTSTGNAACTTCSGDREANTNKTQCLCPDGQEGPVGVSGNCTACESNEISNSNRTQCVTCPAGEARTGGNNECQPCTGVNVPNEDVSACVPCAAGEYAIDNIRCESCPAGQFTNDSGNTRCESCQAGEVARGTGNTSCTPCGNGERTINDRADCQVCPNGQQPNAGKDSCSACPTGQAGTNGICAACEAGQRTINDQSACETCPGGEQPSSDRMMCEQCPAGTAGTDGICERCDNRSIAVSAGLTACVACPPEEVANNSRNECVTCPTGAILLTNGECQACPLGKTPTDDIDACVDFTVVCAGNQIPTHGNICETCDVGSVPDSTGFRCETCQAGTFHNTNNHSCQRCDFNTIAATAGLTACTPCDEDNVSNLARDECVACRANQILVSDRCQTCPLGQTPNANLDRCVDFAFNCPAGEIPSPGDTCERCPTGSVPGLDGFSCISCPVGHISDSDGVNCVACTNGGEPNEARAACVCRDDQVSNNGACECPGFQQNIQNPRTNTAFCAMPIEEVVHPQYNIQRCESLGYQGSVLRDANGGVAELCHIRVAFVVMSVNAPAPAESAPVANARNELRPLAGEVVNECLIRASSLYQNNEGYRRCTFIFGPNTGFPPRPASDDSSRPLRVVFDERGETTGEVLHPTRNEPINSGAGNSQTDDGSSGSDVLLVGFGAVGVIGMLSWVLADGDYTAFNWSPNLGVQYVNGIGHYTYGSRIDFENDNWKTYWSASQSHNAGTANDWIYGSGATWTDGFLRASFTNRVKGLDNDMTFSFRVETDAGSWNLNTGVNADWRRSALNSEWSSQLSISGDTTLWGWQLAPSVGLSWDEYTRLGEEGEFRLDLSREL